MDAAVAETHSATVFFTEDRAFKRKKPVDLGFLDFRTREARQRICAREVELNRRLAPDVYLGVADVSMDGQVCDHLVVMKRLPAERRLSVLLANKTPVDEALRRIAQLIADLHARSDHSAEIDASATGERLHALWTANTDALVSLASRYFDDRVVAAVHALASRYVTGRGPLLASRVEAGRAVDGHGDLLCDDIFALDDGPRILDCIEFDDHLRYGDGLADAAFLAMDLEYRGHRGKARAFLASYAREAHDAWPASLAHHYVAYRAQVRAKVTALRATQGHPELAAEAGVFLNLALQHLEAGRVRLVVVGGSPGTGKSTLAVGLATRIGAVVLRADVVRKELAGVSGPSAAEFGHGIYTSDRTAQTYAEMFRRAQGELAMGRSVILDASFGDASHRATARALAADAHADIDEIRCDVPDPVADARLASRAAVMADPSDATAAIAQVMRSTNEAWPEAHLVRTDGSLEASLAQALDIVGRPLWRLPALC